METISQRVTETAGTIGQNIRRRRESLGLVIRELAAAIEISEAYLSKIERGHVIPGGKKIAGIAMALDTTPNDLMGFTDRPKGRAKAQ